MAHLRVDGVLDTAVRPYTGRTPSSSHVGAIPREWCCAAHGDLREAANEEDGLSKGVGLEVEGEREAGGTCHTVILIQNTM